MSLHMYHTRQDKHVHMPHTHMQTASNQVHMQRARQHIFMPPCLCGDGEQTSLHASRCPLSEDWRQIWMGSIPPVERQFVHSLSDEQYLHLLFMPVSLRRTPAAICPHITFVSNACQAQHSIALGLEPHAPLYGTAMGCDIFTGTY